MAIIGTETTLVGSLAGAIGKIIDLDTAMEAEIDVLDSTNMESASNYKEKMGGLKDAGTIAFTLEYDGSATGISDTIHTNLGVSQTWTVTFPDTSTWVCTGFINRHSTAAPHADKMVQTVNITLTGLPAFTKAAA